VVEAVERYKKAGSLLVCFKGSIIGGFVFFCVCDRVVILKVCCVCFLCVLSVIACVIVSVCVFL
jgi:hypothetical protein